MNTVVCDIDGTLSKVGDRLKYLQETPQNWDDFYDRCDEDHYIEPVCKLIDKLGGCGVKIVMCTGRRESVRSKTMAWLYQRLWMFSESTLLMRKDGDKRHDTEVKPELLYEAGLTPDKVEFIIEDRNSMVAKFRELGYTVLQPADGDF